MDEPDHPPLTLQQRILRLHQAANSSLPASSTAAPTSDRTLASITPLPPPASSTPALPASSRPRPPTATTAPAPPPPPTDPPSPRLPVAQILALYQQRDAASSPNGRPRSDSRLKAQLHEAATTETTVEGEGGAALRRADKGGAPHGKGAQGALQAQLGAGGAGRSRAASAASSAGVSSPAPPAPRRPSFGGARDASPSLPPTAAKEAPKENADLMAFSPTSAASSSSPRPSGVPPPKPPSPPSRRSTTLDPLAGAKPAKSPIPQAAAPVTVNGKEDNKRDRDRPMDSRARRRYDRLFAQRSWKAGSLPSCGGEAGSTTPFSGRCVREGERTLDKERFARGMWAIDEELRRRRG
ncbi:hypothetical protein JCM10213v2_001930 [Rhodosporidiobolus nylandii]